MATTGYVALKDHFDRFIKGAYRGNGLERIRDVYEDAFGKKINLYDVYQSSLRVSNNAINGIITLVGPSDDNIKTGIMPCGGDLVSVSVLSADYLKGINASNIDSYVMEIFAAMKVIVFGDNLANNLNDKIARNIPYCAFLRMCPFYFTFHHINTCFPDMIGASAFSDILEKYFCGEEDIEKIMKSLCSRKYDPSFEGIYSTMTCNNTVDLFY